MEKKPNSEGTWLDFLSDEDLSFVKKFILASGSLKEVAKGYGISYPTVRLRLDRLIAKIEAVESTRQDDAFERSLRALYADGRFDAGTLKQLLDRYEKQKKEIADEAQ